MKALASGFRRLALIALLPVALVAVARPPQVVSQEPRRVEFEIRSPENAPEGGVVVPGYALYYVYEDVDGTCLYRRQDVAIATEVVGGR